jgi:hypothetical protein
MRLGKLPGKFVILLLSIVKVFNESDAIVKFTKFG